MNFLSFATANSVSHGWSGLQPSLDQRHLTIGYGLTASGLATATTPSERLESLAAQMEAGSGIVETIAGVTEIAYDDRNERSVLEKAHHLLFLKTPQRPSLLSGYLKEVAACCESEFAGFPTVVAGLPLQKAAELATRLLSQAKGEFANGHDTSAGITLMTAALTVYPLFDRGGPDFRNEFEAQMLAHSSPITRIPATIPFDHKALLHFWDRWERALVMDELVSGNPNRRGFAMTKVIMLVDADRQSGANHRGIQRLHHALINDEPVEQLRALMLPEKSVTRDGVFRMLGILLGLAGFWLPTGRGPLFLESLTDRILNRVADLSFFELRDLYVLEGRDVLFENGTPLKIVVEETLSLVDHMVAERNLRRGDAIEILEGLQYALSQMAQYFPQLRSVPERYFEVPNPYRFKTGVPKGRPS